MADTVTIFAIIIAIIAILIAIGAIILAYIRPGPSGPTGATGATGATGSNRGINPIGWFRRSTQPELVVSASASNVTLDSVENYNGATWKLQDGGALVPTDGTYRITYSCLLDVIENEGDNYPISFFVKNIGQIPGSRFITEFHTDIHEVTQGITFIVNLKAGTTLFIQTQAGINGRYAVPSTDSEFGQVTVASLIAELISL